jgi:hypothetical protein
MHKNVDLSGVTTMNLKLGFIQILFLITNNKRGNIYCDCNGKRFSFLSNTQQESLLRICNNSNYPFFNLKNITTLGLVMPKNYKISLNRMKIIEVNHP